MTFWYYVLEIKDRMIAFLSHVTKCNDLCISKQKKLCYIYNGQSDEENKNTSKPSPFSFAKE